MFGFIALLLSFISITFLSLWIRQRVFSQSILHAIQENNSAFCVIDESRIVFATDNLNETLGVEQLLKLSSLKDLYRQMNPEDVIKLENCITKASKTAEKFTITIKTKKWLKISGVTDFKDPKVLLLFENIDESMVQDINKIQQIKFLKNQLKFKDSILDSLPTLIWHRNFQQKIDYCNKYFAQAIGKNKLLITEESLEAINQTKAHSLARRAYNTKHTQTEEISTVIFDERRKLRVNEMPDLVSDGTMGYAIDITEVDDLNGQINKIIKSFSGILDHQSTAIAIYGSDQKLKYCNKAYMKLSEIDDEWVNSEPTLDEVLDELRRKRMLPEMLDFPSYKRTRIEALTTQMGPEEELMHLPNERTLRMFSTPHPTGGLLYMFEDVTDYLALEHKNKALLQVQNTSLENLYEAILVFGSDNRVKLSNISFRRMWGFSANDSINGMHLSNLVDHIEPYFSYEDSWLELKNRILENVTDRMAKSGQITRKDGHVLNFSYTPLPNGDHLLSYIDVTDSAKVSNALKERNEALATADKLKTEFMANISYEIINPLNSISGFAELIEREKSGRLSEKQLEYLDGISNASNRLLNLVENLLDLASIESGDLILEMEEVDIKAMLESVVGLFAKNFETQGVDVKISIAKTVETWMLDKKRIKQALFNMISNSLKHLKVGGVMKIEVIVKNNTLNISVIDDGAPVSKIKQSSVFEKFDQQGFAQGDGAEISLYLVHSLVHMHSGSLSVSYSKKTGNKITMKIPNSLSAHNHNAETTPLVVEYSK